MKHQKTLFRLGAFFAALLLLFTANAFAQTKSEGSGVATFTVTAVGKKQEAPPISKDDVQLLQGRERKQIADWKKGDQLALAILIDDSIENTAGGQWDYLRQFITAQPATTLIAVGYMQNNTTRVAQDFTNDHELAAKALRIPLGRSTLGSSPYLSIMDLLKRWPNSGPRRSIIAITSGIDWFRGPNSGPIYPDVSSLIQRAQRQNTNVWFIYYPSSSHRGHSFYLANTAQINIDKVAEETGGESYFLGFNAPVNITSYLDEINTHLGNQYLLSFAGAGGPKGKLVPVKVKTELPDVEFMVPDAVFVPPGS